MFNIFKSNKMENLMDALASVLDRVPDNPMKPEWVGIQSRGMKQWLSMQIAQKMGVCANIHFCFPRQMIDHILNHFTTPGEEADQQNQRESLNADLLFWMVMKSINENRLQKSMSPVENYIKEDETGKKQYQLSMKVTRVFDDYQMYRPRMLFDWQHHPSEEAFKDPAAQWQAELWTTLVSDNSHHHLAYKTRVFLEKFSAKNIKAENLPSRMSLFGISALPELFLQVFEKMSGMMDINLFLLTPSDQFFFDIKSERQIKRIALRQESGIDPDQLYYEMTNPLLSSLGTAGKHFHACLESFNYHEPFDDLFQDPGSEPGKSNTMLTHLQSDILNLVHRKQGNPDGPVTVDASDTSVSIHACHSPMREAQVLKDLLLNQFEQDPDLSPHDIIVMMPDIEAYAPFVESVFSLETVLPFSISDRRKRSESPFLDAFLKILALRNARFEKRQVLDLLLCEPIAQKFKIMTDEIDMIEKMVGDAHILWGKNADHRAVMGLPCFGENTWQFGLQRLFMGMAMPENHKTLVQDILPCDSVEGLDLELLGKLAAFCHTLFSCLETLAGQKTIEKWCGVLKKIPVLLMDWHAEYGEDLVFLNQTIDILKENVKKAAFKSPVSFDMINSHIEQVLDQNIAQGNFLSGNITFCNIMPMRSIPFKIVALMGMDERSFPRKDFGPGFDLIKKYPKPGDRSQRDEDRYLFLETLLSARLRFIITYTGMSIQDNSKIPCAGVVSELADVMDQSFIFPEKSSYHLFHPLHPFNAVYFNQTKPFFSFSKDNCNIATALIPIQSGQGRQKDRIFFQGPVKTESRKPLSGIRLDEMILFFKNPVQGFMKDSLHINIPQIEEQTQDRECFSISGLDQYILGSFLVEKKIESSGEVPLYPIVKATGSLPFGEKGRFEYEKTTRVAAPVIDAARVIASKRQLPPGAFEIDMDGLTISAGFSDIREDGAIVFSFGKLNSARLLSGWIRHLFLNVCAPPGYPKQTILIGRDPKGKSPVVTCTFPDLDSRARHYLAELVQLYRKGQDQPVYFFCETSWQFVQDLSEQTAALNSSALDRDQVLRAMNKAKASWYGGYYQTGERENRYVSLCVDHNDPFESVDTLFASGFVQNAITVYKPLLENLNITP